MGNHSQILIITDRNRVLGEDTDMLTVLSLTSSYGGTPALINALEECRKQGLKQLIYHPYFVRILTSAFSHSCKDDEYDASIIGIMPYSFDIVEGLSLFEAQREMLMVLHSDQPFVPVIDLTGYECGDGQEPMLYLMPQSSHYCGYSKPADSDIYPLTDEGLIEAIDRLMFAN